MAPGASINSAWQQAVLPFCTQVTAKHYPFDRRAAADVSMADFAKLFGPTGLIDSFMTTNLKDLIDTSKKPWTWKVVNGADLGISQAVLDQLQAADQRSRTRSSRKARPRLSASRSRR